MNRPHSCPRVRAGGPPDFAAGKSAGDCVPLPAMSVPPPVPLSRRRFLSLSATALSAGLSLAPDAQAAVRRRGIKLGEGPLTTLRNLGPYVLTTSLRDALILESPRGATVQWVPRGDGVVDLPGFFDVFEKTCPQAPSTSRPSAGSNARLLSRARSSSSSGLNGRRRSSPGSSVWPGKANRWSPGKARLPQRPSSKKPNSSRAWFIANSPRGSA